MLELVFYGYLLQAIGLVIGFLGAVIIGLFEVKTRKEIQAEIAKSSRKEILQKEISKSNRNLILLFTLTISFGLQLVGLALSSV
jgi:hypothetical protein